MYSLCIELLVKGNGYWFLQGMSNDIIWAMCNDLAGARDLNGVRYILQQYLRQVLGAYLITIRDAHDDTYGYFLHDLSMEGSIADGARLPADLPLSIAGDMTRSVLRSVRPVTFKKNEITHFRKYAFSGAEDILGIRLRAGGDDIGILWLQGGAANERLLKGVAGQIAMAIANVLVRRDIELQAAEIRSHKKRWENEDRGLQEEGSFFDHPHEIIGAGPAMQKIRLAIGQVAFFDTTVLIMGETGTGKELIARDIHGHSRRGNMRMIKVNCATLPVNLIESELFGHERGSFTGAIDRKIGKFELANNSTIFLDEIGELPQDMQVKLLRAIQEREIERVGGKRTIKVNVRIVAATNRDLPKEVEERRFRSDLYYRLNVFPIFVPALRHRREDIPLLVNHFIRKLAGKTGKHVTGISAKALDQLMSHNWPGNIRELENCIERSLVMSDRPVIERVEHLGFGSLLSKGVAPDMFSKTLVENERDHIIAILQQCKGKVGGSGGAAEVLDVNTSTLNSRMRKLGIKRGQVIRQTENE